MTVRMAIVEKTNNKPWQGYRGSVGGNVTHAATGSTQPKDSLSASTTDHGTSMLNC